MRFRAVLLTGLITACGSRPVPPTGFARVGALAGGNPLCLWLAESNADQERGLMDVTSLGSADGMLFRFPAPTRVGFYMYRTKIPLTVVFVAPDGVVLDRLDMDPCPETDAAKCVVYRATDSYQYAIEVPRGDDRRLGLTKGPVTFRDHC
jgi:uncharacterized protein